MTAVVAGGRARGAEGGRVGERAVPAVIVYSVTVDNRGLMESGPLAGLPRFLPSFLRRMGGAARATFLVSDADRQRFEELVPVESVTVTIEDGEVRYEVAWEG
jgi:hypothetical protein